MNTSTVHIFVPCTEKHYPSTNRHEAESVTLSSLTPAAIWTLVKATDTSMMQTTVLMEVASLAFPHPLPPLQRSAAASGSRGGRSSLCRRVTLLLCSLEFHTSAGSSANTPQSYRPHKKREARTSKVSASFAREDDIQDDIQDDTQYLLANYQAGLLAVTDTLEVSVIKKSRSFSKSRNKSTHTDSLPLAEQDHSFAANSSACPHLL